MSNFLFTVHLLSRRLFHLYPHLQRECGSVSSNMVHTKHATDTRKPYSGLSRSLVIAIDVGTTFSGVRIQTCPVRHRPLSSTLSHPLGFLCHSRTRRDPENPWCYSVRYITIELQQHPLISLFYSFPGQEHVAGNSKIPSVIYYDKHGTIMAAGAEAESSSIAAQAEDEGWIKAELCVLFLSSWF